MHILHRCVLASCPTSRSAREQLLRQLSSDACVLLQSLVHTSLKPA